MVLWFWGAKERRRSRSSTIIASAHGGTGKERAAPRRYGYGYGYGYGYHGHGYDGSPSRAVCERYWITVTISPHASRWPLTLTQASSRTRQVIYRNRWASLPRSHSTAADWLYTTFSTELYRPFIVFFLSFFYIHYNIYTLHNLEFRSQLFESFGLGFTSIPFAKNFQLYQNEQTYCNY